jgi:nucleotide sugar dehydrogenase
LKKVAVVGLGYVGLPLALLAESKNFDVIGLEKSKDKLNQLKNKISVIDDALVEKQIAASAIHFTNDPAEVSEAEIVIVCVPTPVDPDKNPDLSLVTGAVSDVIKHMKPGRLLVIESTINPGVCDEVIIPLIESGSDHIVGKTIYVAHCPERINPGDKKWNVANINRVVGADSEKGLDLAYDFYSHLVDAEIKKMGSLKEAEAVKIVENSFRDINIAFVNELAMSFSRLGINLKNVIDGAATKPFAFMPHYPGIGVGGHCIPVDPYYLIEYAKIKGFDHKFLSLARSINENMPVYSVELVEQAMKKNTDRGLKEARVVVLGLSYKPNVADDRESPAYTVISELEKRGAIVTKFDPNLPAKSDAHTLSAAFENQDAAILVTSHREFKDLSSTDVEGLSVFFDGRNFFSKQRELFEKNNVTYVGVGEG